MYIENPTVGRDDGIVYFLTLAADCGVEILPGANAEVIWLQFKSKGLRGRTWIFHKGVEALADYPSSSWLLGL